MIGKVPLIFRHVMAREITGCSPMTIMVFQGIHARKVKKEIYHLLNEKELVYKNVSDVREAENAIRNTVVAYGKSDVN